MKCGRCGGILFGIDIYSAEGKASSWACYRCGEIIDRQILINRGLIRAEDYPPAEDFHIGEAPKGWPSFAPRFVDRRDFPLNCYRPTSSRRKILKEVRS